MTDFYPNDDLGWVDSAGVHLWHAIRLYRKHVRPDDGGGPDEALRKFLHDLQEEMP